MREKLVHYQKWTQETWQSLSQKQKWMIIGAIILLLITLVSLIYWAQRPEYVPIYENLSAAEAGEIVETIEAEGVPVQISGDGSVIRVPKAEADRLKVDLAYAGIPRSGNINYGIFSEDIGIGGMTQDQFSVVERDAMQTELRYLMESIDGVEQAEVMLSIPEESVWLSDEEQSASASVVLNTRPGLEIGQQQVNGLYHLVSRSIPHLPVENIEIMDHQWGLLGYQDEAEMENTLAVHQQHREIKQNIEQDIRQNIQQMLGTMFGMDKVVVSVMANVDFTQENREENLVEPVGEDSDDGIDISIERIQETYEGEGTEAGGDAGTGEPDVAGYPALQAGGDAQYEQMEERINREVNRIHRQIEMSPYLVEDLTVHVGIEPPDTADSVPVNMINEVENMLVSVVDTSLSSSGVEFEEDELVQKVSVFESPLAGRADVEDVDGGFSNVLIFGLAAALLIALAVLVYVLLRGRKREEEEEIEEYTQAPASLEELSLEEEEDTPKKQMERFAKNKPDEFTKLLRSWMSED